MIFDTEPWRIRLVAYCHANNLPAPHDVPEEHGFEVHSHGPLRKPGHHFCARMQRHMIAAGHKGVKENGTIDEPTREVLKPPLTRGERVAAWELTQVGKHEEPWGSNSGPDVRVYQSATKAYGLAWCASFQSYAQRKEGYRGPISARAFDWLEFGTHVPASAGQVGDPVVIRHGDGHIGCFLGLEPQHIRVVSGNTGNAVGVGDYPVNICTVVRLYH